MPDTTRSCSFLLEPWLELHDLVEKHPHLRRVLFDPVTGLPTAPLLFPRIESLLEERGEISLLCLNVIKYSKIEEIYGWEVFDEVMREVAASLERITGFELRDSDIVAELMISGNSLVVLLSPPRTTAGMQREALDLLARRIESHVREDLSAVLDPSLYPKFGCYAGAATVRRDDSVRLERLVHMALETALADSDMRECTDGECRKRRLEQIIQAGDVRTFVHPIYRLDDLEIIGYEALSRGPEASEFERPDKLFKVAYDSDLVLKLERLCRHRAFESAVDLPAGRLLFVNIEPEAVSDPELRDIMMSSVVAESNMAPSQIVLEITERTAVEDFGAFRATLEYLRALGFRIAIDDGGAGYGSMQCIAEVHPEWLKIDLSLVRDIDTDDVRRALVGTIATFAERTGVKLIAEGIERPEQLAVLREIGVEYGQGFLFCRPQVPFPADADVTPDL
ncbi:MAG: GGDEF domain-containing protein [Coriobacteriia bacterium]|nr:GGDEF domain-containing protein [Coriobacteriia bacterium]MBN2847267.1 GGDEF domain-containing protein [Coriobacteriia bacterium]